MQRLSGILSGAVQLMIIGSAASTTIVLLVLLSLINVRPLIIQNHYHNDAGFDPQARHLMSETEGESIATIRDGIDHRVTEDAAAAACVHCFLRRLIHAKSFQGSDASNYVNAGPFVVKHGGLDRITQTVDDPHVQLTVIGGDRVRDDAMANLNNCGDVWRSGSRRSGSDDCRQRKSRGGVNLIGDDYYKYRSARKLLDMLNSTSPSISTTRERVIDIDVDSVRNRSISNNVDPQGVGGFDTVDYSRPNTHPPKNN